MQAAERQEESGVNVQERMDSEQFVGGQNEIAFTESGVEPVLKVAGPPRPWNSGDDGRGWSWRSIEGTDIAEASQ